MLTSWCVLVACVGAVVAAPSGVSVQVGAGGVGVDVGGGRGTDKLVDVNVGGRGSGRLVDVNVGGHGTDKLVDVSVGGGHGSGRLVDVNVGGHGSDKLVDVDVGAGGVGVDVAPHSTRSFGKPVEVDVNSRGVNVDVGTPHDTHRREFTKVVDVNVGGQPHTHTHHVFKSHTVDPNFRNTETFTALDNAGSDLFQGLGNAATALGDFLSRILGGGRH